MEAGQTPWRSRTFASSTASIASARDLVRNEVAGAALDVARVADVQLAVSELVTNAVVHGNGEPIVVRVSTSPRAVVCSVTSGTAHRRIPDPATWIPPVGRKPSGRGLAIVRAVADTVAIGADDSTVTVQCTFHRR